MQAKEGNSIEAEVRALERTVLLLPNTPKSQLFASRIGDRLTELLKQSTIKGSKAPKRHQSGE